MTDPRTEGTGPPVPGRGRLVLLLLLTLVGLVVVTRALYRIQIVEHEEHLAKAMRQWTSDRRIERQRGTIYDRRGRELAVSVRRWSLSFNRSAVPEEAQQEAIARTLAGILGVDAQDIRERMERGGSKSTWIARRLDDDVRARIEARDLDGVGFAPEYQRIYPHDSAAAHVLGFVGADDVGLEGIERAENQSLMGPRPEGTFVSDAQGNPLPVDGVIRYPQFDGRNVTLTIDLVMQSSLEQALSWAVSHFGAKGASGVVVDPQTGEVLAMANLPTYNLNEAGRAEPDARRNRAITDVFEPGSTFKIFSGALALANGLVREHDDFECVGSIALPGKSVKCHHPHGHLDYRRAIEVSCNPAAIMVCLRLAPAVLYEGLRAYGFGARTGLGLPGEAAGTLRATSAWGGMSQGMIAMGHEVSVTTIQLAMATAAMANGGRLLVPRLVHSVRDAEGRTIRAEPPAVRAHPVDPSTSRLMGDIMTGVVRQGTGMRARVAGFAVSGKTGTAQIAGPQGGYIKGRYNAVFIGWTPTDAPILAMAIVVNQPDPSKGYYGGEIAAPIFGRVGTEIMRYLRVGAASARDTGFPRPIPAPTPRNEGRVRGTQVEVPDLVGLTLREAHELIGRLPLAITPEGSGIAVEQSPSPGTAVPLDSVLRVKFRPPDDPGLVADIAPEP